MRNDNNANLGGEGAIFSPNETGLDFLPEPGEHDMRKLSNAALNTENFSPDEIVSVQDNAFMNNDKPTEMILATPAEDTDQTKGDELDVVKNNITDQVEKKIDEVMKGQKSPFDFANEIGKFRESYGDDIVGGAA